jgi:AraC-like DNA-binding protein
MSELDVSRLLSTESMTVRRIVCAGTCRHRGAEEYSAHTHLTFPYRGVYVRHVGRQQAVADANHVQFFNATETYRVSHPVSGGDHNLVVTLSEELLRELVPAETLTPGTTLRFRGQQHRIDARAHVLAATLRHGLSLGTLDALAGESLLLALVSGSVGARTSHAPRATVGRRRIVDRVKLVLMADLSRRWQLAEIAAEVGRSPVYLTQLFQQVEGVPLYRYHLRLRLARALDMIPRCDDLAALALELGFSSHAHFTSTFRQTYGRTPSGFKRANNRPRPRASGTCA